ncbi:Nop53p [Saccharomyces eubayanus]|uniref:Nop53p n=1 Tax=Saccharomyces eubayanus TaxID=1080349 RepID=UPI0006C56BEB|nr:NOP53-like protein [Saccharomyces eubayanus]KOG96172.1 NOP53-like protein [Saccharomyces eubayanus]
MAPTNVTKKPSQYKQSSRKGKKAWRKNIDISEVEQYMEKKIDHEVTHGTSDMTSLQNDALFQVDVEGDDILKKKLIKRNQIKKSLKSREILDAVKTNSKISALKHHKSGSGEKSKKIQGVSKHELKKLMALAGRVHGESKIKNRAAKDGLIKSTAGDLWGSESSPKKQKIKLPSGIELDVNEKGQIPEDLLKKSTTGWSIASVRPETLNVEPLAVKDFVELPHAGKSYNPNDKSWSELINKEYKDEKVREDDRVALELYRERISHLMETLEDNEEEESSSDEGEKEEENEDEQSGSSDDIEVRLSINEPVKNKKKTKYQRNKASKHEEKVKLQQELKKLRERVKDLETVIDSEETRKTSVVEPKNANKVKKSKKNKKHKLGTKYSVIDERLEVKFSDELSDSLRKVRPEGNLLYDTVRKLQSSGKIESRVPVKRGRRYKQKITEKWTHKDFK